MKKIVKPEVLAALSAERYTARHIPQNSDSKPEPQPEKKKESWWRRASQKIISFIKNAVSIIVPILSVLPPLINAISRYKARAQAV